MRVGNILKTMGWARKQIRVGGERRYVYQKESV
jgi:hypothetical protein